MRRAGIAFIVLVGLAVQTTALAADPASANFQIQGSSFVPIVSEEVSTNFALSTVVDPIVGFSESPTWNIRHGAPVKEPAAAVSAPPPSGGGGGGGGGTPGNVSSTVPLPTLIYNSPTFASHQFVRGTYPSATVGVVVNGSSNGVQLLPGNQWVRDLPLFLGLNQVQVQAVDSAGNRSVAVVGTIERMLIGDVNRSHRVDDVDLSLFVRAWKQYTVFADFNEDGKIDDIDLSLLASHWNLFY